MGRYDIEIMNIPDKKLTLADLCHELMDEYEDTFDKVPHGEETYRDKFKNYDGSGLIDKLNKNLRFDIEAVAGNDRQERFDMLKLLKVLFYIEKSGKPKYTSQYSDDVKIQITDILAKPRLSNIKSEYSDFTVYGEAFDKLLNEVRKAVPDADERDLRLKGVNDYWEYIIEKAFDYVITDKALEEPEKAINELNRIDRFLKEKILNRLKGVDVTTISQTEGVMKTFYNILICHRLLCNEADRIKINYQVCLSPSPANEYVENFKKYEGCEVKWEIIDAILGRISHKNEDPDAGIALYFISYGDYIDEEDIKHYKYAAERVRTVSEWIETHKGADFSNGIPLDTLAIIMQEIIWNKKHGDKIENDYYGYNNVYKSLLTALKSPDRTDAIVKQAWIKKLENRTAVNFGAYDLIKKKREIETTIFEIKTILYSYRKLSDLEFVNNVLSHFAARTFMSRELAMDIGVRFAEKVKRKANQIREFHMWPEGVNVLDMFREFAIDKNNVEDEVAEDVARQVNELYDGEDSIIGRDVICRFEINYSRSYHHGFMFIGFIDKRSDIFTYKQFLEVCPDEDVDRMIALGLGRFVKK